MPDLGDPDVEAGGPYADTRQYTAEEQRNLAAFDRWLELFNGDDPEAFVREAYAPEFTLVNLDGSSWTGNSTHGQNILRDAGLFVRAETFIKKQAPGRKIRFNRVIPAGNVITLEASLIDEARPGWELSWCGVYTFDNEGRVVSDHSYLNHRDWPGIGDLVGD
jgi:hypothetical protein